MPLLYNHAKGHVENVPEDAVGQAVASGKYQFRKQTIIPVIAPDGAETTIDSADATQAFANGYQYLTKGMSKAMMEQKIEQGRQEAFGGTAGEITAGVLGATRGFSMGLTDVALGAADRLGVDGLSDAVRAFEKYNPKASAAGEIGGTIAGLAVAGPVSAVAKMGSKITAKTGAALAGKVATGKAAPIVERMIASGAGSAVEGAVYGLGEVMGEAALGDPGFTAEGAIATVGLGGIFGGAFGGLVPGAGEAFKQTKKILSDFAKPVMEKTGQTAAHLAGKMVTATRGLEGQVKKDVERVFAASDEGQALRGKMLRYADNPDDLMQDAKQTVRALDEIGKEEIELAIDVRKFARQVEPRGFEEVAQTPAARGADYLGDIFEETAQTVTPSALEKGREALGSVRNVADEFIEDPLLRSNIGKDLNAFMQRAEDELRQAKTVADVHSTIEKVRVDLDAEFKKYFKKSSSAVDIRNGEKVTKAIGKLRKHLVDESLYGEFAKDYSQLNKAMSGYYGARERFQKSFYGQAFEGGEEARGLLDTKIVNAFKNPMSKEEQHNAINYLVDQMDNLKKNVVEVAERRGLPIEDMLDYQTGNLLRQVDEIRDLRSLMITFNRLESSTGKALGGMVMGSIVGSTALAAANAADLDMPTTVAGVPILALAGYFAGNPKFLVKTISRLERGNVNTLAGINNAARRIANVSIPGVSNTEVLKQVGRVSIGNAAAQLGAEIGNSTPVEALRDRISELLSSSVALDEKLIESMPGMDVAAPMTYAAMTQTSRKALEYVHSKIPAPVMTPGIMRPQPQRLNKSEEIRLERTLTAAFNPSTLLKEMDDGVVHPETVDAVRTVYPYFYQTLQTQIMEAVTEPGAKLPMQKAITLSRITGMPTNLSLAHAGSLNAAWSVDEFAGEKFRPGNIEDWATNNGQTQAQKLSAGR